MRKIPLRWRGEVVAEAIVDDADFERVASRRWLMHPAGYPLARVGGRTVTMHRFVLGIERGTGVEVDHVNRDRLDNRRENLRVTTRSGNAQNRVRPAGRASQYRGVSRTSNGRKWRATAVLNQRSIHIGTFDNEIDAARAASEWRAEHMPYSQDARGEVAV